MPRRHEYYLFQQEQEEDVPFQREAKSVCGEPKPRLLLISPLLPPHSPCLMEVSGTCPHTPSASHAGVPADRTRTTAILLREGRTVSSYPCVFFAVTLTSRSNWGPFPRLLPRSAAACPIQGKRTGSARKRCRQLHSCDATFSPNKLTSCDGYNTKTWILPTEESRSSASVKKRESFLFC